MPRDPNSSHQTPLKPQELPPSLGANEEEGESEPANLNQPSNDDAHGEDSCRTPTSEHHKVPAVRSCPPTPRKPAHVQASSFQNKRKLHFFESTSKGREELDLFFQSSFEPSPGVKKRCMSVDFTFWRHGRAMTRGTVNPFELDLQSLPLGVKGMSPIIR
ncbi:cyclin-dependent protein kinase inhibitor SMR2-like [Rhodamnia argentea]|uniref:Cyclin-dependent protein kinase inhibitor SMR2-like n=1 Tax=Rhodamnia argentea TaxID=178133 RepID=A0ABM3HT94_9MYRT|nr:cyclin-dependent protein kinase inhibitor SMR2-like [Rhodamnia argentea]